MVRHPEYIMGFWSGTSDSQGDEFDFGSRSYYQDIREYVEGRIGIMDINDKNLQTNLGKLLNEDRKSTMASREAWNNGFYPGIEIKYVGDDTYLRCRQMNQISYVRPDIKRVGFVWDKKQKSWVLRNRRITIEQIKDSSNQAYGFGTTEGLRVYCERIAYRQSMEGIPKTFDGDRLVTKPSSASINDKCTECGEEIPLLRRKALPDAKTCVNCSSPGESKDTVGVLASNSSKNPYSKIEQLEKLIGLRNKGEISVEEFDVMKKELLS